MEKEYEDCLDCKKQKHEAIKCLGPLGYSAKCNKHSVKVEITEIKK